MQLQRTKRYQGPDLFPNLFHAFHGLYLVVTALSSGGQTMGGAALETGFCSTSEMAYHMGSLFHRAPDPCIFLQKPEGQQSLRRVYELESSWQGVRSHQHGAQALSNVGLRSPETPLSFQFVCWRPVKEER